MENELKIEYIRNELARTPIIYSRGENLYHLGGYALTDHEMNPALYRYSFNGTYGEYQVTIREVQDGTDSRLESTCTCPYPHNGCKHMVAAFLDLSRRIKNSSLPEYQSAAELLGNQEHSSTGSPEVLTPEEIRQTAVDSRYDRAVSDYFELFPGDLFKGQHTVRTKKQEDYTVTVYDTVAIHGHCTCPDFASNHLSTCKHLIFAFDTLKNAGEEGPEELPVPFPFVHLTWNSRIEKPVCYYEKIDDSEIRHQIERIFEPAVIAVAARSARRSKKSREKIPVPEAPAERPLYIYTKESIVPLYHLYASQADRPEGSILIFDDCLIERISRIFSMQELKQISRKFSIDYSFLKTEPYPYQKAGIEFAVFREAAVIADEMGLGKTLQAITTAIIKKQAFGFTKTLIVCPASLKSQWDLEIRKFTDESPLLLAGTRQERKEGYLHSDAFFKITNYEALRNDISIVETWSPDFVILDEAQRIKNFETKTHLAINRIPRTHSLVITGTPLENRLEDLYSIFEFSDPQLFTPLWSFAAAHYRLSRVKKNKIVGYRNLDIIHDKLKSVLLRRTKEEVFESLPEIMENNYYLYLHPKQEEIHQSFMSGLLKIARKKFLTPMDVRRLQRILLCMRMVCNSTFLLDKMTNYSPKLDELSDIIREVVVGNSRKAVIFTEWTTMAYLIGTMLEKLGIRFVEFSGKVPVKKRQQLIDEFREDPECMVFLSTDAGGVGLNLQNCDFLINMELPWNPAKLNQRIGRIHRIGQKSDKLNVINLISRNSIEEKVHAGIAMKQNLFDAVLTGSADAVDFSREEQNRFLSQIREMFSEEMENPEQIPHPPLPEEDRYEEREPAPAEPAHSTVNIEAEEPGEADPDYEAPSSPAEAAADGRDDPETDSPQTAAPAIGYDQLEAVLNQGLSFLNTLTAAATGKELFSGEEGKKHVEVDREKGEVVLRFKL